MLSYGSEVWGLYRSPQLERVHISFCKELLGVRRQTQNSFIYGELVRPPLYVRHSVNVIRFWLKIVTMQSIRFVKIMYDKLCSELERSPNTKSWVSLIRNMLQNSGFHEVWINQGVGDIDIFIRIFRQRVTDIYMQKWSSELTDSTRARTYVLISSFSFQSYIDDVNIDKYRMSLSRLRMSAHRLQVEAGRWHKPMAIPYVERKCIHCRVLEDEFHFVLECKLYEDVRSLYVDKYFYVRPNMIKFIELLTSQNKNVNRKLGMYVFKALKIRQRYYMYYE